MSLNPRRWFPVAVILSAVNLAGVWFAAAPAEPLHATGHAVLAVALAVWAQRLRTRQLLEGTERRELGTAEAVESLDAEVEGLRRELSDAQERLDFAERMLVQGREERRAQP
ncbi:MAG TPA: hypothetical protein VFV65_02340 [Gemmatimonadales bacterium]|nr:hypothetical protein [Gemmatimonadales bacterium]